MKVGQEMIGRWRESPSARLPLLIVAIAAIGIAFPLAVLWYPPPALSLPLRLLAALFLASLVLAGVLRALRWLRADPARPVDTAHLIGLLVLAGGCLVAMVVGGPLLIALQQAVSSGAVLVVLGAGAVVAVAVLGLATTDLEHLLAMDAPPTNEAPVAADAQVDTAGADASEAVPAAVGVAVAPLATVTDPVADLPDAVVPPPTTIEAPPTPRSRGVWAVLDSKWTIAALVVLILVAGLNLLNRQGLLSGLSDLIPAEQAGSVGVPASTAKEAPGLAMPIADVTAREVTPLTGAGVAGSRPLEDARGLVVAPDGRIYVLETGAKQVAMFDPQGKPLGRWGGAGQGDGEFEEPSAIAVGADGTVHVADAQRNAIQKFSPDGKYLSNYGGNLSFYRPRGLARGDDNSFYVADTGRNRIVKISDSGDQEAVVPDGWEARPAVIDQPTAGIRSGNTIYVSEPTRGRLHRLTPEGKPAAPAWAMQGSDTLRSARLTLGPKGEVVLAEVGAGRVLIICPGGGKVLAWRPEGGGDPRAAALGPDGALFVVDSEGALVRARLNEGC